jgi:AcrR family transcriptional regulator
MALRHERSGETRAQIVEAAMAAYRERGIRATSMQEVARRAGVAPNTVLNHFATPELLVEAVIERILESIEVPDSQIFAGLRSRPARLRRLVPALFAFYERSNDWFLTLRGDYEAYPALGAAEGRFWSAMQKLYDQALGSLDDDPIVRATVVGLTHPATLSALREAGLSTDQAAAEIGDLLVVVSRRSRGATP